jgi:hypothetical protein
VSSRECGFALPAVLCVMFDSHTFGCRAPAHVLGLVMLVVCCVAIMCFLCVGVARPAKVHTCIVACTVVWLKSLTLLGQLCFYSSTLPFHWLEHLLIGSCLVIIALFAPGC